MARLYEWYEEKPETVQKNPFGRTGLISFALSLGALVIVLTTVVAPMITNNVQALTVAAKALTNDDIVTGSIAPPAPMKKYTIRRSIMQPTAGAVCIIPDGSNKVQC